MGPKFEALTVVDAEQITSPYHPITFRNRDVRNSSCIGRPDHSAVDIPPCPVHSGFRLGLARCELSLPGGGVVNTLLALDDRQPLSLFALPRFVQGRFRTCTGL